MNLGMALIVILLLALNRPGYFGTALRARFLKNPGVAAEVLP